MPQKTYFYSAISVNLLLGNFLLAILSNASWDNDPFAVLSFHVIATMVALVMLYVLFNKFRTITKIWKVIVFSLLGALSVPLLGMFIAAVWLCIIDGRFENIPAGIPLALIAGLASAMFWVPLGLINSYFVIAQAKKYDKRS